MRHVSLLVVLLIGLIATGRTVTTFAQDPVASPAANASPVEFLWRSTGSAEVTLLAPIDGAVAPDGSVWIVDGGNNRFAIFSPDGSSVEAWGTAGNGDGQLMFVRAAPDPYSAYGGIAFDTNGNFYVADPGNKRVQKFGPDRAFLTKWGSFGNGDGQFGDPVGVAIDAQNRVYVIDDRRDDVQVFDANGQFLFKFASHGTGEGQINGTGTLGLDAEGNAWIADLGNDRIVAYDAAGNFLTQWGTTGTDLGELESPDDVAVDAAGNLYVTDSGNFRIQVFDRAGHVLAAWGSPGTGDGEFRVVAGIFLDGVGNVYVVDPEAGNVQKFRLLPPLAPEATPTA
jgi:DNA-binding beta-propeller fold protein YncE